MWPSASSSPSSSASSYLLHGLSSRRLLLHTPLIYSTDKAAAPPNPSGSHTPEPYIGDSSFHANIVMILSVLLCALICALGLNIIIRCALRCSSRVTLHSNDSSSTILANTGVKRKALKRFPTIIYSEDLKLPGLDKECSICLSEFTLGERLRVLPKCNHGFHVRCIDKWLISHSSCPTCRHCLIETCQKVIGYSGQASTSTPSPPLQGGIMPLEPEGLICSNNRSIC
ncbi:hypothetical protein AQUCO_02300120v1 [Aquilegia coerulea]|uniref:RING-type domain-containing protein n=1 Tax=Aquilegia coerulea TaxID=218851 RepID=A0A2G5DC60_AQUCA|nr:hypothetical protein AQUCO_02300120v1 [Aquilegia coerulea]